MKASPFNIALTVNITSWDCDFLSVFGIGIDRHRIDHVQSAYDESSLVLNLLRFGKNPKNIFAEKCIVKFNIFNKQKIKRKSESKTKNKIVVLKGGYS